MRTLFKRALSLAFVALACAQFSSPAAAATTWNGSWNYSSCSNLGSTPTWGNSYNCTDTDGTANAKMNISGWSSDLQPSSNFAAAAVYPWGSSAGFGIVSKEECGNTSYVCDPGTGPHAADNLGNLDGFLLNFSDTPGSVVNVALNSITVGWNGTDNPSYPYNDSDISVYYYTGNAPTNGNITGMSAADLAALNANPTGTVNGWKLLNHYTDVGAKSGNTLGLGNTSISSSWWLVTASNKVTGTTTTTDAFKLLTVAGTGSTTPPGGRTPEPASLALAGVALFGLFAIRRRQA